MAAKHMSTLVEFVFTMRERLDEINQNSYNNFMLRVGEFRATSSVGSSMVCYVVLNLLLPRHVRFEHGPGRRWSYRSEKTAV